MAKDTPESLILEALGRAAANPTPLPLHGTKARPGIFLKNTAVARTAAQVALDRKWLQPTGQTQGQGKSARSLFCITASGVQHVLEHAEVRQLLSQLQATVETQRTLLDGMCAQVSGLGPALKAQVEALRGIARRVEPPDVAAAVRQLAELQGTDSRAPTSGQTSQGETNWMESIVSFVRGYPAGMCPLPELYRRVAEPKRVSVGQFHDGLRQLVAARRLRLHPWTGPMYQLQDEKFALLLGQEIKYYADVE